MKKIPIVLAVALVYLMTTTAALANAYSANTFKLATSIPGYSGSTDLCLLSGIETGPSNTGVITSYFSNPTHCQASDQRPLASGYLGVYLQGLRDGFVCGNTGWIYSNVNTHYWQIWSNLCSNPAGSQSFDTLTSGRVWTGSGYTGMPSQWSPTQNY